MKIHPSVIAAHAEHGGDLETMQKLYVYPDLVEALKQSQKALSMMITPTQIDQTTTLQAFAIATEAEAKARDVLSKAGA